VDGYRRDDDDEDQGMTSLIVPLSLCHLTCHGTLCNLVKFPSQKKKKKKK